MVVARQTGASLTRTPTRAELDALMTRLAEGEREALGPLYEGLWSPCHRLASRILGDPVRAEDVAQQALMKLVGQAAQYDPEHSVVSWALTLVAWECRTVKRRDGRRREVPPTRQDVASEALSPEDVAIRAALLETARAALQSLSATDRETLELAFGDDPPSARPVGGSTFRKRRQRALTRLRAAWRSLYDG